MNWLQWFQLSLALATQVLPIIQAIEAAIGASRGAEKKTLAVTLMTAGVPEKDKAAAAAIAGPMIDATVTAMNATGKFAHGAQ